MSKLVLANIDYCRHMTDEGEQLQAGLEAAGWRLVGHGYEDGCTDVPTLLARHRPSVVFVQDKRDWSPDCSGCFNPAVAFTNLSALADWAGQGAQGGRVWAPVKDAGSLVEYQRAFLEEISAKAPHKPAGAVIYYHRDAVLKVSPWLKDHELVRTYHSVDAELCRRLELQGARKRGLVSGAASGVYPLRRRAIAHANMLGIDCAPHPGYGNSGSRTPNYLRLLSRYRVHVATASVYGFALRKIVESVAVGCTPVTDLPAWDVLPEIDGALVRVSGSATVEELREAIDRAERGWNIERAREWARACWGFYDWRAMGRRLSEKLNETDAEK